MKKNNRYFNIKKSLILAALICQASISKSQNPGLIISEFLVNPSGADSPFEYVEFRVSKNIDFSVTPYSVVVCNNGTATSAGWISGGAYHMVLALTLEL
jgi:hypothetical protein